MFMRMQSFLVGMAIAAALFAAGWIVYGAFSGDDGGEFVVNLPTRVPTLVSAAPTQRPQTAAAPTSLTPAASILSFTAVPATTPVAAAAGDRASCDQIRGTAYRSDAERVWFTVNCLAATPTPQPVATASAPAPGAPAAGPRDPFIAAFASLISEYDAAAAALDSVVDVPQLADAPWRGAATAGAQRLQSLGAVAASVTVPSCLAAAQAPLAGAVSLLQLAANLTLAGLNQSDVTVFLLISQPIATGRASLAQASQVVDAAAC